MAVRNVAIIGAGVAGLTSIKSCLDAGLTPTCFEQQPWLGGLWNYSDEVRPNIASVHRNTVTNTSKLLMCFSDFPIPKEFPNYMSHRLVQKYLEMYTAHFDLEKYIQFDTVVERLSRSEDHAETGRWVVSYRKLKNDNSKGGEITHETFDAVMVCNGHLWDQAKPNIPGMESFKGAQVHSGDYRSFYPYIGKKVVVVGCGNSAGDIACELSCHSSQVYLSTRSGCFLVERLGKNGKPVDMQISRAGELVPIQMKKHLMSGLVNTKYDMANLGLEPTGVFGVTQFPIVNDMLPHRVVTGSIIIKSDVEEIKETSVVFKGGDVVENVDALVFCTGFKLNFPFAKDIIPVKKDCYASLYKHMFLPDVNHNTLVVIGVVGVTGPDMPLCEMQARVAGEVFAGRCSLPCQQDMMKEIKEREEMHQKNGHTKDKFMHIGLVSYIDELAAMIGAKPNLWALFMEDPKLALRCYFSTWVPAQYRLQGPNSKDTRDIINGVEEQYLYPLRTRKCPTRTVKRTSHINFLIVLIVAFVSVICIVFNY